MSFCLNWFENLLIVNINKKIKKQINPNILVLINKADVNKIKIYFSCFRELIKFLMYKD